MVKRTIPYACGPRQCIYYDVPPEEQLPVHFHGIGWEQKVHPTEYFWDGSARKEDDGRCLFQYTIAGEGAIRFGDRTHVLGPGVGFLVWFPDDHEYYLPETSEAWEFIWILLSGREALAHCRRLVDVLGHVAEYGPQSSPVETVGHIYRRAMDDGISDAYHLSQLAYRFLMSLYRHSNGSRGSLQSWPGNIGRAIMYIKSHYDRRLTLDDVAEVAGLSKYHFSRRFRDATGQTPNDYLRDVRIEAGARLLRETDLTVQEVANQVGYASGSYFSSIFRDDMGVSPSEYRARRSNLAAAAEEPSSA